MRLPNGFQIENACQPLALTLPLKSNGDSARPLGNSRLSYRTLKLMRRGATVARSEMILLRCMSPVVALLRHHEATPSCPLPGVKRSCRKHRLRSECDPTRTFGQKPAIVVRERRGDPAVDHCLVHHQP